MRTCLVIVLCLGILLVGRVPEVECRSFWSFLRSVVFRGGTNPAVRARSIQAASGAVAGSNLGTRFTQLMRRTVVGRAFLRLVSKGRVAKTDLKVKWILFSIRYPKTVKAIKAMVILSKLTAIGVVSTEVYEAIVHAVKGKQLNLPEADVEMFRDLDRLLKEAESEMEQKTGPGPSIFSFGLFDDIDETNNHTRDKRLTTEDFNLFPIPTMLTTPNVAPTLPVTMVTNFESPKYKVGTLGKQDRGHYEEDDLDDDEKDEGDLPFATHDDSAEDLHLHKVNITDSSLGKRDAPAVTTAPKKAVAPTTIRLRREQIKPDLSKFEVYDKPLTSGMNLRTETLEDKILLMVIALVVTICITICCVCVKKCWGSTPVPQGAETANPAPAPSIETPAVAPPMIPLYTIPDAYRQCYRPQPESIYGILPVPPSNDTIYETLSRSKPRAAKRSDI